MNQKTINSQKIFKYIENQLTNDKFGNRLNPSCDMRGADEAHIAGICDSLVELTTKPLINSIISYSAESKLIEISCKLIYAIRRWIMVRDVCQLQVMSDSYPR